MNSDNENHMKGQTRRNFLKQTAAAAIVTATNPLITPAYGQAKPPGVAIVSDGADVLLKRPPVQWALQQLREAFKSRGLAISSVARLEQAPSDQDCILVASRSSALASQALESAGVSMPTAAEALGLVQGKVARRPVLLVCGADVRGQVYGVLEMADRVRYAEAPLAALRSVGRVVEQPANPIRGIARLFTSEVEDKPWFYDKGFWQRYLDMLATQRFNRFNLTLGLVISKQLAELMGGTLWVQSKVNEGSTFHCSVPFRIRKEGRGGDASRALKLSGERILVIENHPTTREILSRLLTDLELPPHCVSATEEALAHAEAGEAITFALAKSIVERYRAANARQVLHSSESNEWYTPKKYVDGVEQVLGEIDLDPASSRVAQKTVMAAKFYDSSDDGLTKEWGGRVWMNPPYAQPLIQQFTEKLISEVTAGRVSQAIALTHNSTDTAWFHIAFNAASAVCFTKGRIAFLDPRGAPCATATCDGRTSPANSARARRRMYGATPPPVEGGPSSTRAL